MRFRLEQSARQTALAMLAAQTFYKVSGIALLAVLARALPAKETGIFFFAVSLAEALLFLANANLNPPLMRRVAAAPDQAQEELAVALGFRIRSSAIYLGCVGLTAWLFARDVWPLVLWAGVFTLLEDVYFTFGSLFLALKRIGYNISIGMAVQTLFITLTPLALLAAPRLSCFMTANLIRGLSLVGAAAWVCQRHLFPLRISYRAGLLKQNLTFTAITALSALRGRLETLLLGLLTDYSVVGSFSLAYRVLLAGAFVPMAVGQALYPHLAADGLAPPNRGRLRRAFGLLLGLGLAGMLATLAGAESVVHLLYGRGSEAVTPLLRGLSVLFPLSFLELFLAQLLPALYQEKRALVALSLGMMVGLLGNLALVPAMGAQGAVWAQVLATVCRLIFLLLAFPKQKTPPTEWVGGVD